MFPRNIGHTVFALFCVILSFQALLAVTFITQPYLYLDYAQYDIIRSVMPIHWWGVVIAAIWFIGAIGVAYRNHKVMRASMCLSFFYSSFFALAFMFTYIQDKGTPIGVLVWSALALVQFVLIVAKYEKERHQL